MKITGQILRENREKQGMSINEVSVATKISARIIVAIEDGDMKKLPPKSFLRGFVQTYASFLKLDVENIMTTFHEEMGSTKPELVTRPPATPEEPPPREENFLDSVGNILLDKKNTKAVFRIAALAGLAVLIGLIVIVKNQVEKYEKESVIATPTETLEALDTKIESEPAEVSKPEIKLETPKEEPTAKIESSAKTETTIVTPAQTEPPPQPTAPIVQQAPPVKEAAPVTAVTPKQAQELIIEALDNIEVSVQVDGSSWQKIQLKPEEVRTVKASGNIEVKVSDGGAVSLVHNGKDIGVPGNLGKPIQLKYP